MKNSVVKNGAAADVNPGIPGSRVAVRSQNPGWGSTATQEVFRHLGCAVLHDAKSQGNSDTSTETAVPAM